MTTHAVEYYRDQTHPTHDVRFRYVERIYMFLPVISSDAVTMDRTKHPQDPLRNIRTKPMSTVLRSRFGEARFEPLKPKTSAIN